MTFIARQRTGLFCAASALILAAENQQEVVMARVSYSRTVDFEQQFNELLEQRNNVHAQEQMFAELRDSVK